MAYFEKYKLGKMTKAKFVESKSNIDEEIENLKKKLKYHQLLKK